MRGIYMVLVALVCAVSSFFFTNNVHAQTSAGVTILPAFLDERADPGTELSYTVSVTNESEAQQQYFIYTRDIKGVDNGSVPIFADPGEEKTGFELTEWLTIPAEPVTLAAGETVNIPITIRVPQDATPGSHFGGVFVSAEPPRLREIGAGVGYEVVSIISIRISGDIVDTARIRSFATSKLIYGDRNLAFSAKVENQGNILIRPHGSIVITGMFGGEPLVVPVNESLAGVFPGTIRDFDFTHTMSGFAFGRYEAEIGLTYDGAEGQKSLDASVIFWVFPTKVVFSVLAGFAFIFLIGYLSTRYYVNQAIMRAAGGRRIASTRYRRRAGVSRGLFVFVSLLGACLVLLLVLLVLMA